MGSRLGSVCSRIALALSLLIGVSAYANDRAAATGEPITTEDLKNAKPVATFTTQEFLRAVEQQSAQRCREGTVTATSDGSKIFLDGSSFSDDEFASEILRRIEHRPIYCLKILGPGSDAKRVNALLGKLRGTTIESVSWNLPK